MKWDFVILTPMMSDDESTIDISQLVRDEFLKLCDFVKDLGVIQISTPKSCVSLSETP